MTTPSTEALTGGATFPADSGALASLGIVTMRYPVLAKLVAAALALEVLAAVLCECTASDLAPTSQASTDGGAEPSPKPSPTDPEPDPARPSPTLPLPPPSEAVDL